MAEVEKKPEEEKKVEEESSSSDEGEHAHDENCDHGHDHDDGKKGGRGEKKFKKAMGKMGLKPVPGINRVTIKKGKAVLLCLLFSLWSASTTQTCGDPQEPRAPTSSSASPTSTAWEQARTRWTSSATPSTLKDSPPPKPRANHRPKTKLRKSKSHPQRTSRRKDSPPKTSRWSWSTASAPRPKPSGSWERPTTTQSTPSWNSTSLSTDLLFVFIYN